MIVGCWFSLYLPYFRNDSLSVVTIFPTESEYSLYHLFYCLSLTLPYFSIYLLTTGLYLTEYQLLLFSQVPTEISIYRQQYRLSWTTHWF